MWKRMQTLKHTKQGWVVYIFNMRGMKTVPLASTLPHSDWGLAQESGNWLSNRILTGSNGQRIHF